jgi:hypothetical protein
MKVLATVLVGVMCFVACALFLAVLMAAVGWMVNAGAWYALLLMPVQMFVQGWLTVAWLLASALAIACMMWWQAID